MDTNDRISSVQLLGTVQKVLPVQKVGLETRNYQQLSSKNRKKKAPGKKEEPNRTFGEHIDCKV